MKRFYVLDMGGKIKYTVNFHNGVSKHSDGSDFFDIEIFKNKKKLAIFVKGLVNDGYIEKNSYNSL